MSTTLLPLIPLLVVALLAAAFGALVLRARTQRRRAAEDPRIRVESLTDDTRIAADGAVLSVQSGEVWLPSGELDLMWTPENLERLARTYWHHLSKMSGRTLRVMYTPTGRAMALFGLIPLITFHEPDYDLAADRGAVRWRIRRGLLVSQRGANRDGYLQIVVERLPSVREGMGRCRVEVTVANFYPSIADRISRRLYSATQSRLHVTVAYGFLRSLANGNLVPSRVGRFTQWPRELGERREARAASRR